MQKVLRVITKSNRKKVQYCYRNIGKMDGNIIILYFSGSNNIFADCTYIVIFMIIEKGITTLQTYQYLIFHPKMLKSSEYDKL